MTLDSAFRNRLHTAVCTAFNYESLEIFAQNAMGIRLENVVVRTNFETVAHRLINFLEDHNRVGEFLDEGAGRTHLELLTG